jgi:hypothetical protein
MKLGINCKVLFNTGTEGSPVWLEIKSVNDWKEDAGWAAADANDRSTIVDQMVKTTMQLGWSGTVKRDGSEGALAVASAFLYRDPIDTLILDGPMNVQGSEGYRLYTQVHNRNNDQGRGTVIYDDIQIKPTIGPELPRRATVGSGGTIAYADITGIKPT